MLSVAYYASFLRYFLSEFVRCLMINDVQNLRGYIKTGKRMGHYSISVDVLNNNQENLLVVRMGLFKGFALSWSGITCDGRWMISKRCISLLSVIYIAGFIVATKFK